MDTLSLVCIHHFWHKHHLNSDTCLPLSSKAFLSIITSNDSYSVCTWICEWALGKTCYSPSINTCCKPSCCNTMSALLLSTPDIRGEMKLKSIAQCQGLMQHLRFHQHDDKQTSSSDLPYVASTIAAYTCSKGWKEIQMYSRMSKSQCITWDNNNLMTNSQASLFWKQNWSKSLQIVWQAKLLQHTTPFRHFQANSTYSTVFNQKYHQK